MDFYSAYKGEAKGKHFLDLYKEDRDLTVAVLNEIIKVNFKHVSLSEDKLKSIKKRDKEKILCFGFMFKDETISFHISYNDFKRILIDS